MDRDHVIAILRAHEPELKAAGVVRLRVFGSVARGEHGAESDVDIVVDFDETNGGVSLLDLVHLENRLCDLLGVHVDLVQGKSLKTRARRNVEREAVLAF
jgi:predicted nucleotidyltransferase